MTLEELKKWFQEFRSNPQQALFFLFLIIICVLLFIYLSAYVKKKAEIQATTKGTEPSKEDTARRKYSKWKITILIASGIVILLCIGIVYHIHKGKTGIPPQIAKPSIKEDIAKDIKPSKTVEQPKKTQSQVETLHDFYLKDFPHHFSVNNTFKIGIFERKAPSKITQTYNIEFRLHFEVEGASKFISFLFTGFNLS